MKKADVADSQELTKVAAAIHLLFNGFPISVEHLDRNFAEEATMLHSRPFRALMPAMGTVILESIRREKNRQAEEQSEHNHQMALRAYRERAEGEAARLS
jgi:hypothetical protein